MGKDEHLCSVVSRCIVHIPLLIREGLGSARSWLESKASLENWVSLLPAPFLFMGKKEKRYSRLLLSPSQTPLTLKDRLEDMLITELVWKRRSVLCSFRQACITLLWSSYICLVVLEQLFPFHFSLPFFRMAGTVLYPCLVMASPWWRGRFVTSLCLAPCS